MRIVNGKPVRNVRNTFEEQKTRSIRAATTIWAKVDRQAENEGMSANMLVVKAVGEYCDKNSENKE